MAFGITQILTSILTCCTNMRFGTNDLMAFRILSIYKTDMSCRLA